MAACRNCKWLKETIISDQVSTLECVRPNRTGNLKAHIESLASLLIQCHKKDIGLKAKDTGNISNK